MSSISFGDSGSVFSGTRRPLIRRSGGRPGFRWRSEASFFVTNFRSSVRSIVFACPRRGTLYGNTGGRVVQAPARRASSAPDAPRRGRGPPARRGRGRAPRERVPRSGPRETQEDATSSNGRGRAGRGSCGARQGGVRTLWAARATSRVRRSPAARRKRTDSSSKGESDRRQRPRSRRRSAGVRGRRPGSAKSLLASFSSSRVVFHLRRRSLRSFSAQRHAEGARERREGMAFLSRPTRETAAALARRRASKEDRRERPLRSRKRKARRGPSAGAPRSLFHLDEPSSPQRPFEDISAAARDFRSAASSHAETGQLREEARRAEDAQSGSSRRTPGRGGARRSPRGRRARRGRIEGAFRQVERERR